MSVNGKVLADTALHDGYMVIDADPKAGDVIRLELPMEFRVDVYKRQVLGLGWAATPAGLEAMEELQKLEEDRRLGKAAGPVRKRGVASNEMCTFLIVNISSLQLIPVSVIAYRSQYGSVNPTAVVGPGIVATAVSTGAAILFCRIMDRKS